MLQILSHYDPHQPMNVDDLAARFKTLAADRPHTSRSPKFAHIGTLDTLRQLAKEGFDVHGIQVQHVKDAGRVGYEKHLLRLRKPGTVLTKVGDVIPEVIMRNAHDGTSAWSFSAGMMRLLCLNGMTVGTTWGSVRVKHVGRATATKVIDATYKVVDSFARVTGAIETFQATELSDDDQHRFAEQAFALRYSVDAETGTTRAPVTPYAMLTQRRFGDAGNDLWTVFNRVQENVLRGGLAGRSVGSNGQLRRASTRAVTGIDQSLRLNRRLFDLAESWAVSKASPRVPELAGFAA